MIRKIEKVFYKRLPQAVSWNDDSGKLRFPIYRIWQPFAFRFLREAGYTVKCIKRTP